MAHPVGERLRCDDCGAEVVFVAACNCPAHEQKKHSQVCCDKEMRNLGVMSDAEKQALAAGWTKKAAA